MSSRPSPSIKSQDIEDIVHKWESERLSLKEHFSKPVVLFVGDTGAGKSSCIRVMLNITDESALEHLKIIDHGQYGTTDESYKHQSRYVDAIDIRGKLHNQNIDEYAKYLSKILEKEERIDIIIGVINAYGDRHGDIDTLIESLSIIYQKWEKPFVVLMNKFDQVRVLHAERQFEARKKYLEEQSDEFRKKLTWKFENHPEHIHGVFPVSAKPIKTFSSECPNKNCVKAEDEFDDETFKTFALGAAARCDSCKTVFILRPEAENVDLERIRNIAASKRFSVKDHEILPEGLRPRGNLMQTIFFLTHELVGFALMKTIAKDLSDHIVTTVNEIRNAAGKIYGQSEAVEIDRSLCAKIAKIFGLEQTALEHSEYEASRWKTVGTLEKFQHFLRRHTHWYHQGLSDYIAAWGIYYARKFHDVAVTLSDGFKVNEEHQSIANKCNKICAQYTNVQQLEYYYFILEKGREAAFKKYILEYERPQIVNTVTENPSNN